MHVVDIVIRNWKDVKLFRAIIIISLLHTQGLFIEGTVQNMELIKILYIKDE